MKRNAVRDLNLWKEQKINKPLWITGIRGTGKTYLALEFAKSFFDGYLYANIEAEPILRNSFLKNAENKHVGKQYSGFIEIIEDFFQVQSNIKLKLLFVLDEVTSCSGALELINDHFYRASNISGAYSYIFLSSLPGRVKQDSNLYEYLHLYPMAFDEFITAAGYEWYADIIRAHFSNMKRIPEIVHQDLLNYFWDYIHVGGMPAAVSRYLGAEGLNNTYEALVMLQSWNTSSLLQALPEADQFSARKVMDSLCPQLIKDNRKFQYSLLRKGAAAQEYSSSISHILDNGLALICPRIGAETSFKLYFPDTGLLYASIISHQALLCEDKINKLLLENYVIQSLQIKHDVYFWESSSKAKLDAVIHTEDGIVPFEIIEKPNNHSKSLLSYIALNNPPYSYKLSTQHFTLLGDTHVLPFYAMFCLNS